jgi:hypothetical protein
MSNQWSTPRLKPLMERKWERALHASSCHLGNRTETLINAIELFNDREEPLEDNLNGCACRNHGDRINHILAC